MKIFISVLSQKGHMFVYASIWNL